MTCNKDCLNCVYADCIQDETPAKKEKIKEYRKRYYEKHKEKIREKNKQYFENNPEKLKQYRQTFIEKRRLTKSK